jgi:Domain of unknown function (DUF4333)
MGPNCIRIGWSASAVAVSALALTACGGNTIDPDRAEGYVVRGLTSLGLGTISSVHCDVGVDAEPGANVRCRARSSKRGPLVVTLRVLDDDGTVKPIDIRPRE